MPVYLTALSGMDEDTFFLLWVHFGIDITEPLPNPWYYVLLVAEGFLHIRNEV